MKIKNDLIEQCYKKSIDLLKNNSTKYGILASSKSVKATQRNYLSVFGRDASICLLGMVASKDKELIKTAKKSLLTLVKYQALNGQIPNYVKPEAGYIDFYYTGCIDATLWWLIAVQYFDKNVKQKTKLKESLADNIEKAVHWLECHEHQKFFLVYQNEASDWADIMPRSGYVLYSNALWYEVKKLYNLKNKDKTKKFFNYFFDPNSVIPKSLLKKDRRLDQFNKYIKRSKKESLYISYLDFARTGYDEDVLGNLLACLTDLAGKKKTKQIADILIKKKSSALYPVRASITNIEPNSKEWRAYMERYELNMPDQYHNGGIWPFIGGFWCIILSHAGLEQRAREELHKLAYVNSINKWQFNEWFHGKNGKAMGMHGQSWNAAMFIMAYQFLKRKRLIM